MSKTVKAKNRVLTFVAMTVVAAAGVAGVMYWHHQKAAQATVAEVGGAPDVASIPGAGAPPASYVKEQDQQNAQLVKQAAQNNGSAFPTITRAGFIGSPEYFADQANANGKSQCPINKTVNMFAPNPTSCSVGNLKLAHQSGVTAEELRCQACSCPMLRMAGYTAGELAATGYTARDLKACGFDLAQLKDAGFSAQDLAQAGFTAAQLRAAGYYVPDANPNCSAARANGESASTLIQKGCGVASLQAAGFSAAEIAQAQKIAKMCSVSALKQARAEGVSATQLRQNGCGLAALKAAGFTAQELKDAGYTAAQLKNAGFDAQQLKNAGFTAAQLKAAGFSAGQLKNAGFTAQQLKDAGFDAKQLRNAGFTAAQLKAAGFTPAELTAAGFTKGDLLRAGFTPAQAGYDVAAPTAPTTAAPVATPTDTSGASASMPSINPSYDNGQVAAQLRALQAQQQAEMTAQQQQDQMQEMQAQMSMQAQKMLAGWSNSTQQQFQQGAQDTATNGGVSANGGQNGADVNTGPVIKAGTVLFATLDTGINSDENSPIMATILTGDLKGSKLVGNFDRENDKVVLKFNVLSVPSFNKSVAVNIVAIDQNTANTAVTGNVNNHYLLRYGTLFASSFLSGLSQGIVATSSQTNCLLGVVCQTQPKTNLSTGEYVAMGLGSVGQQYSNEMGQNFNLPPTVKVPSGTGIGLLFMQDLTLPQPITNNGSN